MYGVAMLHRSAVSCGVRTECSNGGRRGESSTRSQNQSGLERALCVYAGPLCCKRQLGQQGNRAEADVPSQDEEAAACDSLCRMQVEHGEGVCVGDSLCAVQMSESRG